MKKTIENHLKNLETLLSFSDISWWLIDYKNDPNFFYCNDLMINNFNLDKSLEKHPIDYENFFYRCKEIFDNQIDECKYIFPFFDERSKSIKYFSRKSKVLEKDKDGNIVLVYGIIEEITQKVIQEKENQEYLEIIDNSVITSRTNKMGIITNISTAYCNITGYSKEELIGKKHSILKHPDTPRKLYREMWRTVNKGKKWEGELKNIKKDGSEFWIQLTISPTFDDLGNIKHFTTTNQDITDKKIIEKLSIKDTLTDTFNRRKIDELLEKEFHLAQRYNMSFSIVLLDIDYFKSINDEFGHLVGDEVLVEISKILKKDTRKVDHVGRWGGEEFLIICPYSSIEEALNVANKLKISIENHDFGFNKKITASFGVTNYKNDQKIDDILSRADKALYLSKNYGRNQVQTLN